MDGRGKGAPLSPSWPPRCPVCGETVVSGEVVVFDRNDLIHVDCRRIKPVPRIAASRKPPARRAIEAP